LFAALEGALTVDQRAQVARAFDLMLQSHEGQRRDDGTTYAAHPMRVALILARELGIRDPPAICAALLHDVLEDRKGVSADELGRSFGPEVARMVETVTKPYRPGRPHREVNEAYFPRLRAADELTRTVKLADRLDNVRDLPTSPYRRKRRRIIEETRAFYLPLARGLADARRGAVLAEELGKAIAVVEGMKGES
jgi:guanosine-3',5'-bis(diphosphate) 3'-pyrophosphohydrolase